MLEAEATARAKVGTCEPLERGREDSTVSWNSGKEHLPAPPWLLCILVFVGVQQLLFPC